MKYLVLSFLVFSAFLCLAESQLNVSVRDMRDGLLIRANYITTLVSGEIKILKFEGHILQAEGLTLELEQLILFELSLRASDLENLTDTEISRLNMVLAAIEDRISRQLWSVSRLFYSRAEVEELIRRTNSIVQRVSETVQRLKLANMTIQALGLEGYETQLIQLETALRAAVFPEEIRALEELLVELDYKVSETINGLDRVAARRKRDLREDVLKRAEELIAFANSAVQALTAQNRSNAADLIRRSESNLQLVAEDLKNVTAAADIGRLEGRLIELEYQLVADLETVGRAVSVAQYLKLLVTSAEGLREWALVEIEVLRKANQTAEIAAIEEEERIIAAILSELQNSTTANSAQLLRIEQRLNDAEYRLYSHLRRLMSPEAYRRQLTRIAEELAVRALVEIRALGQANRTLEAEGLLSEFQELVRLDVELRDAVTNEEIQILEVRLQRIEERIYQQLRALGQRNKRDLRDDVLKRAEELLAIADNAIKAFQADNRTNAVQLIQRTERDLKLIVTELIAAANSTNQTRVQILEGLALRAEFQLVDDLRRLGRPVDLKERRELLITAANGLYQYATAQINALKAQNRTVEIARIEAEEKVIGNLVAQLKNATLESDLSRLEDELASAESRLYEELRLAGQPVITRDEYDRLLRAAEELIIKVIVAIRNLEALGSSLLAEGLRVEEQHLIHLDVLIRTAVFPEEIASLEARLKEETEHITAALAQISATTGSK